MKPLIIVNPTAGNSQTEFNWLKIKEILDLNKFEYDHVFTEYPKHASEIAKKEVAAGRDAIIAIGGDGTYSEVVNGMMSAKQEGTTLKFGVIASGTGNDFIKSAKIPNDFEENCRRIIDPHFVPIDVGLIEYKEKGENKQYFFVNSVGMGFDAEVIAKVQSSPKNGSGTAPFVKALLKVLPKYKPINVGISVDDEKFVPYKIMTAVVANGSYFGGGMMIAPDADIRDSLFNVVTVTEMSKARLLRVFPSIYKGTHVKQKEVVLNVAKKVVLNGPDFATIQADGEVICRGPITVTMVPGALQMMF